MVHSKRPPRATLGFQTRTILFQNLVVLRTLHIPHSKCWSKSIHLEAKGQNHRSSSPRKPYFCPQTFIHHTSNCIKRMVFEVFVTLCFEKMHNSFELFSKSVTQNHKFSMRKILHKIMKSLHIKS